MKISLRNAGKRFNREWIFRHVTFDFVPGYYAITGANGSGKSTLLQVIAGATIISEGEVMFEPDTTSVIPQPADPYKHLSLAAPYLDLIEEMTATEFLKFHGNFKKFTADIRHILGEAGLSQAAHKQIRYFSSGMKQRLKLGQAFFSDTPVLLLDEPTTNLDADGTALYLQLIEKQTTDRLVIISSNDPTEYAFCGEVIRIADFK
jgi:ABC-type multidrug transport system ATPase subunit